MAHPKPVSPYKTFTGGDGRKYALHLPMIHQIVESCAAAEAKNKYSSLETTWSDPGWFGSAKAFKNVRYNRKAADAFITRATRERSNSVWAAFSGGGGGGAMATGLMSLRHRVKTHSDALAGKFEQSDAGNKASLQSLENQVYWSKFARDNGLSIVAALATGGSTVYAGVAATAITLKTGLRVNDMRISGKLGDGAEVASVTMDAVTDTFFCVLAPATGSLKMGEKLIIAAFVKAPIEGAKTAMNGGNLNQIMFSVALEGAGPLVDHVKDYLGDTLLPMFLREVKTSVLDAGLSYAKDKANERMALPAPDKPTAGQVLAEMKNFVLNLGMSESEFMRRYVVVPL